MSEYLSADNGAYLSADRLYRYWLTRTWAPGPTCVFIGLNPSTADETADDPTIRRCIGFARREGCGRLLMLNLFAYRATDPAELLLARDPVGPENDMTLHHSTAGPRLVIAAWGAHAADFPSRAPEVLELIDRDVMALGTTKFGYPRHPLYLRADAPLVLFSPSTGAQNDG